MTFVKPAHHVSGPRAGDVPSPLPVCFSCQTFWQTADVDGKKQTTFPDLVNEDWQTEINITNI